MCAVGSVLVHSNKLALQTYTHTPKMMLRTLDTKYYIIQKEVSLPHTVESAIPWPEIVWQVKFFRLVV